MTCVVSMVLPAPGAPSNQKYRGEGESSQLLYDTEFVSQLQDPATLVSGILESASAGSVSMPRYVRKVSSCALIDLDSGLIEDDAPIWVLFICLMPSIVFANLFRTVR